MLKVFGKLDYVVLEAYGSDDNSNFIKKYSVITGENPQTRIIDRKNRNWKNQFRIYFNAQSWVVESLRKLGYNIMENKTPKPITDFYGTTNSFPFIASNTELFWRLIQYGYKLGYNENIPFMTHEINQSLKVLNREEEIETVSV